MSGLALAMGPVIGGVLVGLWSWRAVFWFNLIFGALVLVAAAIVLPENSDPVRARLDVAGFVLGALAIAGLVRLGRAAGCLGRARLLHGRPHSTPQRSVSRRPTARCSPVAPRQVRLPDALRRTAGPAGVPP